MAKITKKMNGEEKIKKAPTYEGAKPDHKYDPEQVALRNLYSEIVKKNRHNL
jgi:hypothetical protein